MMNQQMTIEKMKSMRLRGMAQVHYSNLECLFRSSCATHIGLIVPL